MQHLAMETIVRRLLKMARAPARPLVNPDSKNAWRGEQESQGLGVGALSVGVGRHEELCGLSNVQKFHRYEHWTWQQWEQLPLLGPVTTGAVPANMMQIDPG